MYLTKNSSDMQMSSFAGKLYRMCVGLMGRDQGGGIKVAGGRGGANIMQNEAVDSQHGTGVEEYSHLCYAGHHLKLRFLHLAI